jgi:multidrug efflux pump subunit AcrB
VKAIEDGRSPMERIKDFSVRNNRGQLVPLAGLVDVKEIDGAIDDFAQKPQPRHHDLRQLG